MKLARINTVLLILIILINGYTIALPAIPGAVFWWQNRDGQQTALLEKKLHTLASKKRSIEAVPAGNRLIVPSMAFDQAVFEGGSVKTLSKGLWHRPGTSSPDKGGNTVFAGHRLTYTNPRGTLYHLDKVSVGDQIGVWWKDKLYSYRVTAVKTVEPNEAGVEASTKEPQLTIYTCTPLWLPNDRLVVIAKPEKS